MGFCKTIFKGLLGFGAGIVLLAIAAAVIAILVAVCVAIVASILAYYVVCLFLYPFLAPVYVIAVLCWPKTKVRQNEKGDHSSSAPVMEGKYKQSRDKEALVNRIKSGFLRLLAYATLVVLVGLLLSISVGRLKRASLLGSPLWKWCLLGFTFSAGYFEALALIMLIVLWKKDTPSYYFMSSLFLSMSHVTYFGMVLVTWQVYFGTVHGLKQDSTPHPQAFEYMTWTFLSLFVGSILWLFKSILLARWSADVIYRRFEPRILITSLKYFFIGLVGAKFCEERIIDELQVLGDPKSDPAVVLNLSSVTKYVMSRKMGLTYLDYVSSFLASLAQIVTPLLDQDEEEGANTRVGDWIEGIIKNTNGCTREGLRDLLCSPKGADEAAAYSVSSPRGSEPTKAWSCSFKETLNWIINSLVCIPEAVWNKLKRWLWLPDIRILLNATTDERGFKKENISDKDQREKHERMLTLFCEMVRQEGREQATTGSKASGPSADITSDDFKKWMVDAHKDCLNMGRTLVDAKAMVTRLDVFMSSVIIVIILLLWILITGVASTKVLVTIATPFLALTFIFGDAAKTFFQGLIFCFGTHPFDVGDRCILDEIELEVKSVSILTTTFMQLGSKEKRFYPNSELATKAIVNLGCQPDATDAVELTLDSSTNLIIFEKKITEFLTNEKLFKEVYKLKVKEVGENIKVTVHFTHVLAAHDLSHTQCFVKKTEQRSYFLKIIKNYIHESRIDTVNANDVNKSA